MRYPAGKMLRLRRRDDIRRLFECGRRAADGLITLLGAPAEVASDTPARAAVAVSGRLGNAVKRNRVKRLCREAFRHVRAQLPAGWDFVVIPRRASGLTVGGLQESIRRLAGRLRGERRDRREGEEGGEKQKEKPASEGRP